MGLLLNLATGATRLVLRFLAGRQPPQSSAPVFLARMTAAVDADDMAACRAAADDLIEDSVRIAHEVVMATAPRRRRRQLRRMGSEELADALYALVEPSLGDNANEDIADMFRDACRAHAERVSG